MKQSSKIKWYNHFIELIIVIIGISVAFWLNNLSNNYKENSLKQNYLSNIYDDLQKDSLL